MFEVDVELNWCFLLFHFLSTLSREFKALLPSYELSQTGDFDELIALQNVVMISLKSKTQNLVKYDLQQLYMEPDLTPFLRELSESLALLKMVDKTLALDVWEQAFRTATACYIFYFVHTHKETFADISSTKKGIELVATFERECERLAEYFKGFVRAKAGDTILVQGKLLGQYLKATDPEATVGFLKSLISSRVVKSRQLLVITINEKGVMTMKKPLIKNFWDSLEGQCSRLIDLSHLEQLAESLKTVACVPVQSFLQAVQFKGWIYKKGKGYKAWFSKSRVV